MRVMAIERMPRAYVCPHHIDSRLVALIIALIFEYHADTGKYVLENFALSPATEDALAIMAYAYIEMDFMELAEDATRVLRLNYPYSEHLVEIDNLMVEAEERRNNT